MPLPPAFVPRPLSFHSDQSKYGYILYQGVQCKGSGWGSMCHDEVSLSYAPAVASLRALALTPRRRITQKKLSATNPSCYSRKRLVANSHTAVKTSGMTHTRTSSTASDLTRPPCLVTTRYRPANSSLVQTFSSP